MPGYGEVWYWIGSAYSDLGDLAGFQSAYDRAVALDPRNVPVFSQLGYESWQWHRYAEAVAAFDRALVLAPDMALAKYARAMVFVQWRGQLDTLRAVLEHGPEDYGVTSALRARVRLALWERRPEAILALLPEPQRVIFASQEAYEPGLLWAAWAHQLRGDSAAARRAFGGALGQLDSALRVLPGDGRARVSRGLALAGLGRRAEAQRIADDMRELSQKVPAAAGISGEPRARILAQAGFTDAALLILEQSMAGVKSYLSGPMLRLDPRWDPIRREPRFQALVRRYGG
jgi:tetratricopeptide (TPR) repeat protein